MNVEKRATRGTSLQWETSPVIGPLLSLGMCVTSLQCDWLRLEEEEDFLLV